MSNSLTIERTTRNNERRQTRLLEERADMLAMTDDPKAFIWEITCDGFEHAGAPRGTMCVLKNRQPENEDEITLVLIHNSQRNCWTFGHLFKTESQPLLFEPDRDRLMRLLESSSTICGVLIPLVPFKGSPMCKLS